jgi:hypothetical protein
MRRIKYAWLLFSALYELARYDVISVLRDSASIRALSPQPVNPASGDHEVVRTICNAISLAACLYWKPVRCLQQSVCTVRLLRNHDVVARLVIGYRPMPFFLHAWVEVDGRIVNDSLSYRERLQVLYTEY